MGAQKERASAIVSAGGKIHAMDGHRVAAFCFVDLEDKKNTTKMVAVLNGDLTDADVYAILDQLYKKVGLDRFVGAANELALAIAREDKEEGVPA